MAFFSIVYSSTSLVLKLCGYIIIFVSSAHALLLIGSYL